MLIRPARVATIAPTATINNGAIVVSVSPQAPGERMLPSISADHTARADPPVADTRRAESSRAPAIDAAYSATVRP